MDALLAIGGEGPERDLLASRFSQFGLICAADSGLDLLRSWGLRPGLIVGDMDSLSTPDLLDDHADAEILRFPEDKDDSDTELGLRTLRERGAGYIVIAGGGEGRLDHLLALRALFDRESPPDEWHTARESLYLLRESAELAFSSRPGELISVFPLAGGASGMESEGLVWPLSGLSWGPGQYGLSNRALGGRTVVRAGKGKLLVIRNRAARSLP